MDSGQAIRIGQPGVHDCDVEAEATARSRVATSQRTFSLPFYCL
jgi:hypothetical protein